MFAVKNLLVVLAIVFASMDVSSQIFDGRTPIRIEGKTMGTTYAVVYFDENNRDFSFSIDSLLKAVNKGINNYDPASDVSVFNKSKRGIVDFSHFVSLTKLSLEISTLSEGSFDPTVMPLVNLWGFGPEKNTVPSQRKIDSIRAFVGYSLIQVKGDSIVKLHPSAQLDFGGIGQGYGVDMIRDFLKEREIKNFLVELGGEGYASGQNIQSNSAWKVGVIDPSSSRDEQQLMGYAVVSNSAFTTSGNYFNYRIVDGKKVGHTISPFDGFPVQQNVISVSVFAQDCTLADAWATAFMVAGKKRTLEILKRNPKLGALMIYKDDSKQRIFISDNLKKTIFLDVPHDH
jgi:FAD:protein FMN transferase